MKTQNTFSISFFLKKDKAKNGNAPLFARITVNGDFRDLSTKRWVKISDWNQKQQKLLGKFPEDHTTRDKIRLISNEINLAYNQLQQEKKVLTAESVKSKADGTAIGAITLKYLLNYHNVDLAPLIEEGTLKNYFTTARYLEEFLINKRKKKDIYLDEVNNIFITDFGIYLMGRTPDKGQRPCSNNTLMKHMERFKKVIAIAFKNRWIRENPFLGFERRIINKDRECLDSDELNYFAIV